MEGGEGKVPSTGKSSNSSSSSKRAGCVVVGGFETADGSTAGELVGWSLAVGTLEDILREWGMLSWLR